MVLRRLVLWIVLISSSVLLSHAMPSWSANTHGTPDPAQELQASFGDALQPFIASGCLPTVPSSSLTLVAFACKGWVRSATHTLVYVDQAAATLTLANTDGVHWLALHRDTSTAVGGWTRRAGSHYLVQQVTAQPVDPSGGLVVAQATVSGGVISAVADFRQPASYARRGVLDVKDPLYGAVGDGTTDDTTALQTALTAVSAQGGGVVHLPRGTYRTTAALTVSAHTTLQGVGRKISTLLVDHSGDGLRSISATINGNTGRWLTLRGFGLDKTPTAFASSGGGFVDVAGSFIDIDNVFIRDFDWQIILDQSEHVEIHGCEFIEGAGEVGIWLVSGPEHTVGALPTFTNVITIRDNQFNSAGGSVHIQDDGGVTHTITGNNFNAGATAIYVANSGTVRIVGNFFENQTTEPITLGLGTKGAGTIYFPNYNPTVHANAFSTTNGAPYHVTLLSALNGEVTANDFVGAASMTAMMRIQSAQVMGTLIASNSKFFYATSPDKPFINSTGANLTGQRYRQRLFAKHVAGVAAGVGVVLTPAAGVGTAGTLEVPRVGESLLLVDADLLTSEIATVTATSATTLTATLVNAYAANFSIFGLGDTSILEPIPPATNQGTGTIAAGACPCNLTITHGLTYNPVPAAADITITQLADTTAAILGMWVSNITATTFRVNIDANPGASGYNFGWRIHLPYRQY